MLPVEETIADWRWSIPAQPGQPGQPEQLIATDKRGELAEPSIEEDAA
jgi:electron transport complex protein RnfB